MSDPLLFLIGTLAVLGVPGPTNTLLATAGATVGLRRALPLLAAELAGYLLAIGAIRLLLGPVLAAEPWVATALRLAVGLYLALVALGVWRSGAVDATRRGPVTARAVFITTLLNPKALVFALVVLPFGHPGIGLHLVAFALAVPAAGAGWMTLGSLLAAGVGGRRAALLPRIGAAALASFAGLMLVSAFA
jgi:threonine/homoserine/homoserine lactone efflux protein